MKKVLLINGASGVGKSTIAEKLCEDNNFYFIRSYTNRPPRTTDDQDHIYCSNQEASILLSGGDTVCSTMFGEYTYFTLEHQFINELINVYIVDDLGLLDFSNYSHNNGLIQWRSIRLKRDTDCDRQSRDYSLCGDEFVNVVIENEGTVDDAVSQIKRVLIEEGWL